MICQHCQREFISNKHWAKFCSATCRVYAARGSRLMPMRNTGKVKNMNTHVATDERLLSRPQLAELVGCSPAHVRRMEVNDPAFPKPVRVSAGITRWRLSDVRAYFAGLKTVEVTT